MEVVSPVAGHSDILTHVMVYASGEITSDHVGGSLREGVAILKDGHLTFNWGNTNSRCFTFMVDRAL